MEVRFRWVLGSLLIRNTYDFQVFNRFRCSAWKLPTGVQHVKKIVICNMCNDDWNIDHRRWSKDGQKMSSLGGPNIKKIAIFPLVSKAVFRPSDPSPCIRFPCRSAPGFQMVTRVYWVITVFGSIEKWFLPWRPTSLISWLWRGCGHNLGRWLIIIIVFIFLFFPFRFVSFSNSAQST